MYSSGINLNASSYKTLFSSASGSLYVPVKPSAVIYSQLDYVHGVSAGADGNGVPVNRIRILNSLIHQLVSMKKDVSASSSDFENMDDSQKDALIKQYQQQIADTINQAGTYGLAGLMPENGALFSIQA